MFNFIMSQDDRISGYVTEAQRDTHKHNIVANLEAMSTLNIQVL